MSHMEWPLFYSIEATQRTKPRSRVSVPTIFETRNVWSTLMLLAKKRYSFLDLFDHLHDNVFKIIIRQWSSHLTRIQHRPNFIILLFWDAKSACHSDWFDYVQRYLRLFSWVNFKGKLSCSLLNIWAKKKAYICIRANRNKSHQCRK